MWKYIKGTEKDFEGLPEETQYILRDNFWHELLYYMITDGNLFVANKGDLTWNPSIHPNIAVAVTKEDGTITAQREWIEEPVVETKEEQQPLPTKEQMNPSKDLPKIKLDVKKPIFNQTDDLEIKFIYSNKFYHVFENENGSLCTVYNEYVDDYYYNKPDVKTTEQLISEAWTYACNDGSLWASPTQLYYIAIKELIKHGVIDVSKTHEISDDANK